MKYLYLLLIVSFTPLSISAISLDRIEPAFWWVGMENPHLQIMVHGEGVGASIVNFNYPNVKLSKVIKADSPNYLFLYLEIGASAEAGEIELIFSLGDEKLSYMYSLKERVQSKGMAGFDNSDVMYLLMPDRFSNGDESNDNLEDVMADRNDPDARHGGDFKGILNHLDYIRDLGVTTLWLNPVFENRMPGGKYHGYHTTDFYKIDPRLGSNEDYKDLVKICHDKGLKVVSDMIINHIGDHHWWMTELPYVDWIHQPTEYVQTNHYKWTLMDNHAVKSERDILLDGWFYTDMPDLNQRNPHLAAYLIQNAIWWIEFSGIDGIRMDTYPYNDFDMMAEWCKRIYQEYPDFNIVGEAWYEKSVGSAWWQAKSKLKEGMGSNLETMMDFELTFAMENAFESKSDIEGVYDHGMYKIYEVIAQDFMYSDPDNILIFLDNHDLSRFNEKEDIGLDKYKQSLAFLLTTRGIPQIYYGTEILMTGMKADGDGLLRLDFPGGWENDTINAFDSYGRTELQNEAWNYMQNLLQWRKRTPTVYEGKLVHYTPDRSCVYVYARIKGDTTILIMLNGLNIDQTIDMKRFHEVIQENTFGIDAITGDKVIVETEVNLKAKGVYILELSH